MSMDEYTTGTGQRMSVHSLEDCKGPDCVIHNPSDHAMKDFPTHWRSDRQLMERICPHGIGHPDPDDIAFKQKHMKWFQDNPKHLMYEEVHGCDGCCGSFKGLLEHV